MIVSNLSSQLTRFTALSTADAGGDAALAERIRTDAAALEARSQAAASDAARSALDHDLGDFIAQSVLAIGGVTGASAEATVNALAASGATTAAASGGALDDLIFGDGAAAVFGQDGRDVLVAGAEGGALQGGNGDDRLYGDIGDDALSGGAGDDALDGGAGEDVAIFRGAAADYTITRSGDAYIVAHADGDGADGVDTLRNVETLQFSDGVLATADAVAVETEPVIGQAGTFTLTQANASSWTTIAFDHAIENAVVVVTPNTTVNADPFTTRVRNVTSAGFEVQIDEYDYLDGVRTTAETFSYLAVSAGVHRLENGLVIQAGNASLDTNTRTVAFAEAFDATPVVLTQVASDNDLSAVAERVVSVSKTGFTATMREQEAGGAHVDETVAYIALDASAATLENMALVTTGRIVTHGSHSVSFGATFDAAPVTLAEMQSHNGSDTAAVVATNVDTTGARLSVREEQSRDSEVTHVQEVVGLLALKAGALTADGAVGEPVSTPITPSPSGDVARGTSADDRLIGTPNDDVIKGRGGDDLIYAFDGSDIVKGGDGDDVIYGGGADELSGGDGDDVVVASDLRSVLSGGDGSDLLIGGAGDDRLMGGYGADTIDGGEGDGDVAEYAGGFDAHQVMVRDGYVMIAGDEGVDILANVERFRFAGVDISLEDLTARAALEPPSATLLERFETFIGNVEAYFEPPEEHDTRVDELLGALARVRSIADGVARAAAPQEPEQPRFEWPQKKAASSMSPSEYYKAYRLDAVFGAGRAAPSVNIAV